MYYAKVGNTCLKKKKKKKRKTNKTVLFVFLRKGPFPTKRRAPSLSPKHVKKLKKKKKKKNGDQAIPCV